MAAGIPATGREGWTARARRRRWSALARTRLGEITCAARGIGFENALGQRAPPSPASHPVNLQNPVHPVSFDLLPRSHPAPRGCEWQMFLRFSSHFPHRVSGLSPVSKWLKYRALGRFGASPCAPCPPGLPEVGMAKLSHHSRCWPRSCYVSNQQSWRPAAGASLGRGKSSR